MNDFMMIWYEYDITMNSIFVSLCYTIIIIILFEIIELEVINEFNDEFHSWK